MWRPAGDHFSFVFRDVAMMGQRGSGHSFVSHHFGLGSRPTHRVLYSVQVDTVWSVRVRHLARRSLTPDTL